MDDIRLLRKLNAVGPFTYFKIPLPACAIRIDEAKDRGSDLIQHWHRMIVKNIQRSQKVWVGVNFPPLKGARACFPRYWLGLHSSCC